MKCAAGVVLSWGTDALSLHIATATNHLTMICHVVEWMHENAPNVCGNNDDPVRSMGGYCGPTGRVSNSRQRGITMQFRHVCYPCDECNSTGKVHDLEECGPEGCVPGCGVCEECEGKGDPCDCEARWEEFQINRARGL